MEKRIEKLKVGDCVLLHEKGEVVKLRVEEKTEPTKPNTENKPKTQHSPCPKKQGIFMQKCKIDAFAYHLQCLCKAIKLNYIKLN